MTGGVQRAVFPGFIAGCLFLIFFTTRIISPSFPMVSNPVEIFAAAPVTGSTAPEATQAAEAQVEATPQETGSESQAQTEDALLPPQDYPIPSCAISSTYPQSVQQWCELVTQYAVQNGLDPNLIAAVMLQESGGNSDAYSKSGAVGLMQVMPRDGLAASFMCKNGPCFSSRPSMSELYNPEFNIAYGTHMLSGLIQQKGDVREALKSYGPMDMGYRYADIVLSIWERYR